MEEDVPNIVVVGSSNMDLVVKSARIPIPGETILGGDFLMVPGGKGANQAVAAAKLGARVHFVARLGNDVFGRKSLDNFRLEGLDTTYVSLTSDAPSGVALITVDEAGNNAIVVAPGANGRLSPEDVRRAADAIQSAGAVVAQLEVPLATVECAAELAREASVPFILNPAPAQPLTRELLEKVAVLTPNESEARILTGIEVVDEKSARKAAQKLVRSGAKAAIVTMGAKGFLLADGTTMEFVPAIRVKTVDATAAGDAFTGSLAVALALGQDLHEAARFANWVAAFSVTRLGAQPSMPTRHELEEFIAANA
ncbi:MAG TPA: ribokinase [Sedimentisphaerales bacterium]|jgi:ribokinase|nr:ribokinase [Sedimentisphaerales bacterium]HNU30392.1 ribokinase [Sedimentisphaerales bacterium]